jgi:flagellar FliL protein
MKKIIILIIALVFLLIVPIVGFIIYEISKESSSQETIQGNPEAPDVGYMYSLDTIVLNLLNNGGRKYIKVELVLELENDDIISIEEKKPVLLDEIISNISSKSAEEIITTSGKDKLKEELKDKLNNKLNNKNKIKNIYFNNFIVQ